jgi:septum formation protein
MDRLPSKIFWNDNAFRFSQLRKGRVEASRSHSIDFQYRWLPLKPHVRLILASRSPRRQLLLKQIGYTFVVRPSRVKEGFDPGRSPAWNAGTLARLKAQDVAGRMKAGIVVGADTIVAVGSKVLGKPKDRKDARRMLRTLSGRSHCVYTGFALVDAGSGRTYADVVKTRVWFRNLASDEIDAYVASGSPLDKAGAYGIQDDFGAVFVERIQGCFYNVVGFPLVRFHRALQDFVKQ